jgi:hypothetical protein
MDLDDDRRRLTVRNFCNQPVVVHAEEWIRTYVEPAGEIELVHDRAWAAVYRVPLAGDDAAWFKACRPVQAFEPRLTAELHARWPDRVVEVIAHDLERRWLLLADGGTPIGAFGNSPEAWEAALPPYAELQRGETAHAQAHLDSGVPDRRVTTLPELYQDMLAHDLPLEPDEVDRLRRFERRFEELCDELSRRGIPDTVQHDDLHLANVYAKDDRMLLLDWGDSAIAHPFSSLVVTFHFLDVVNHLPPEDPWYDRLRDVYLEAWGSDQVETFELAQRIGTIAYAFGEIRHRDAMPEEFRPEFDRWFPATLRRAVAQTEE